MPTKRFITYFFPGSFLAEEITEEIPNEGEIALPATVPKDCYGFRFSMQNQLTDGAEVLKGEMRQTGPTYYIGREVIEVDIPKTKENETLIWNVHHNSPYGVAIKTRLGNWVLLDERTECVSPTKFSYSEPRIYKNIQVEE